MDLGFWNPYFPLLASLEESLSNIQPGPLGSPLVFNDYIDITHIYHVDLIDPTHPFKLTSFSLIFVYLKKKKVVDN